MTLRLPDFQLVDHPGAQVLAREEAVPWVRFVLEGNRSLHLSAEMDRGALVLEGRRPLYVIPARTSGEQAPEAVGRWAVKRYARGGRVLPALLGERYLRAGLPRPFREARVSQEARRRGVPTPRVVAAAVYARGLFYQGDLVTEFVPGAADLAGALFDPRKKGAGGAAERLDALRASGALLRLLARSGLQHRDLHAGNVLLQWEGSAPKPYVLDLDRAEILPEGRSGAGASMLRRLRRSLRKWEGLTGLRLSEREWDTLDAAASA